MTSQVAEIVLWLFVVNHGIALGAGRYETRMMVSPWIDAVRRTPGALGTWWLRAAVITLVERIMTFGYFIPRMLALQRGQVAPESRARATALEWARLNDVRSALSFAAWLAALKAFSLLSGLP